ncbi:hypothetical protein AB0J28_09435 [Streptosporangium canum]|uniref:DNA polymerase III subunit beta family protein n=1 Tax=Streptosporangium canum TaxID=324952 RepID=UPI003447AE07
MSTITITKPSALLHMAGLDLKALFGAVLAHASDDEDDLPDLTKVHVEVREGELRLACTDRYTLAVVRRSLSSTTDGFTCQYALPLGEIKALLKDIGDSGVHLTFEENQVRATFREETSVISGCVSGVPWRMALNRMLEPADTPTGRIAINPRFLARLESAMPLSPAEPMRLQMCGEHKAVIATLGTSFLALIMPVRTRSVGDEQPEDRPLDGWFDLLDETPSA